MISPWLSRARSDQPAAAADPARHGEPARERAARPGAAAASSRQPASSASCWARARSVPTSSRACGARRTGPTLCYLGHVDTVLADPAEWTVDPWSGELRDGPLGPGRARHEGPGCVRGRGRMRARAVRWRPARGELLVVATCDEEAGATIGAQWLCENVPEKVRCDMVVNEGAGRSSSTRAGACTPCAWGRRACSGSGSRPRAAPATPRCLRWATTPCCG